MKKIILTGGGTAGHVTGNLALVPSLKQLEFDILYIGTKEGMEKKLCIEAGLNYKGISSGKLRRYFDLKNFSDPFRVIKGYFEAKKIIRDFSPDVIFSKGGYVSVPVVYAASRIGVPVILHESDVTIGLANRLSIPFADKVCCNFPETLEYLPKEKSVLTGSPIRKMLLTGSRKEGLLSLGFTGAKPVLLVMGGSLGSQKVNTAVRAVLDNILGFFDVVHLTGNGNIDESLMEKSGYVQLEYANEELKDIFAASDICISRAGANAIWELVALNKPALLIPLPASQSRGDQILNARSFKKQGFADVLYEEDLNDANLLGALKKLWENRERYQENMKQRAPSDAVKMIIALIKEITNER